MTPAQKRVLEVVVTTHPTSPRRIAEKLYGSRGSQGRVSSLLEALHDEGLVALETEQHGWVSVQKWSPTAQGIEAVR